jgi:hypothetical protein
MLLAGVVALVPSCASPPTPIEIDRTYDADVERLMQLRDEMIASCNGDVACIREAYTWFRDRLNELFMIREKAREANWRDAYERRKEWEKKIRDMLPNWPDLKSLIPKGGITGSVSLDSTALGSGSSNASSFVPVLWDSTITITGTVQFAGSLQATADVSGSISLSGSTASDGTRTADIYSGSVVAKVQGRNDLVTMTIEKDARNRLVIAPDGTGTLTMVVTREISDNRWNALVPYYIQVQLPVTRTGDDRIHVNINNATMPTITRQAPFLITDYNGDGVRDHTADYAALLADHAQHADRADMNVDGVWDQADLDMWENLYLIDQDGH